MSEGPFPSWNADRDRERWLAARGNARFTVRNPAFPWAGEPFGPGPTPFPVLFQTVPVPGPVPVEYVRAGIAGSLGAPPGWPIIQIPNAPIYPPPGPGVPPLDTMPTAAQVPNRNLFRPGPPRPPPQGPAATTEIIRGCLQLAHDVRKAEEREFFAVGAERDAASEKLADLVGDWLRNGCWDVIGPLELGRPISRVGREIF